MKKLQVSLIIMSLATVVLMAFNYPFFAGNSMDPQEKPAKSIPDEISSIMHHSCFDCHSDLSSNEKALNKLNFSEWDQMSDARKVAKLGDISDILKKGDMPPAKYLEKYPDHAPTQAERAQIENWADEEAKKLMGQ